MWRIDKGVELLTSALEGLHAVGYARVSTDDKGQDTAIQIDLIKKWAEANGVILDSIFEEDMSGAIFPRPRLSEALLTVRTTGASMLICYDQSRLTRDADKHLPLIKDILGKSKVIRFVVNGDQDPDSIGVKIVSAIKGVTDSEERRVLKEKTSNALTYRRDVLHIHVGRPARLVITDSPDTLNKGLIGEKTIVLTSFKALNFAKQGWHASYVARKILMVPPVTFLRALDRAGLTEQYNQILEQATNQPTNEVKA